MEIASVILLILFVLITAVFIIKSILVKDFMLFIFAISLNTVLFVLPICIIELRHPNKKDVEKGNAIFVRYDYKTIKNNDTISYTIYEIEWKNK